MDFWLQNGFLGSAEKVPNMEECQVLGMTIGMRTRTGIESQLACDLAMDKSLNFTKL